MADEEKAAAARSRALWRDAGSPLLYPERKAYLEVAGQEGAMPEPANRQQRRAMEKLQRQQQRRGR